MYQPFYFLIQRSLRKSVASRTKFPDWEILLRKTILIATLYPGEKHISQGFVRSISSCEPLSWMTNSPLSIICGPMPVSLKLTLRIAVKARNSTQFFILQGNV